MSQESKQIVSIQILRGIAAWLVVYHHYSQAFFSWDMSNSIFGTWSGDILRYYGKLGVDIFFVISGFIIFLSAQKAASAKVFIKNRLYRIIPPYWFYTLLLLFLSFLIPDSISSDWTIISIIKSLLFIYHENPSPILGGYPYLTVGWTLNFEVIFYILCMASMFLFKKNWHIAIIILLLFSREIWPFESMSYFFESKYIREFGWGIIIGLLYTKNLLKINNRVSFFALIASIVFFAMGGAQENKILAIVLLVTSLLMYDGKLLNKKPFSYLVKLGDYSYSTYLVHAAVSIPICIHFFSPDSYYHNDFGLFLVYTSLTLSLSYLSYNYIEHSFAKYIKSRTLQIS
ncbi:acyltransferase [Vibrio parahaemolyticus]|nr:acyltransferase [Vibrio parahaemolyticus]